MANAESLKTEETKRFADGNYAKRAFYVGGAVVVWFLAIEAGTEIWYRINESSIPKTIGWNLNFPDPNDPDAAVRKGFFSYQNRPLGASERDILRFKEAESAAWRDVGGNAWQAFLLEWDADKRLNQTDLSHNPTSCLPAAGLKLRSTEPDLELENAGVPMRFRSWIFESDGVPIYVYAATRRERQFTLDYDKDLSAKFWQKLAKPLSGNRGNPLETLQMFVTGPVTKVDADRALQREVERLVDQG